MSANPPLILVGLKRKVDGDEADALVHELEKRTGCDIVVIGGVTALAVVEDAP